MPNLGSSLNIGLSGLQASQEAINVIGHNISNVNTPGYSRQSVTLATNTAVNFGNMLFGTGVTVTSVQSLRDQFLNLQLSASLSSQYGAQARYQGVEAISSAFSDNGTTGLSTQIQQYFASIQTLSASPEDEGLRQNVLGRAQTMLNELKSTYQQVDSERTNADQQVGSLVPQINTLTTQIAMLNNKISQQVNPSGDNDAIDQRQALTDQLAQLTGIQVSTDSHNNYMITLDSGAATLVSGGTAYQMSTVPNAANGNMQDVIVTTGDIQTNVTGQINGGTLGGELDLRDNVLPAYQTRLDQIAGSLAGQVNQIQMTGYGMPDTTGNSPTGNLFFTSGGIDSTTGLVKVDPVTGKPVYSGIVNSLQVNQALLDDPSLIACSDTNGVAGNNKNALKLAALQTSSAAVDVQGNGTFSAGPFSTVVSSLINSVATQAQSYNTVLTNQQNLTTALKTQKASASGVDLDEEAAQLLAYQQSYQAAAQFISTISKLTTQLINAVASA